MAWKAASPPSPLASQLQGKWKISSDGGTRVSWRGDGKELFYLQQNEMMAVPVKGDADVALPAVAWCIAVLRSNEGKALATCRVVQP